MHNQNRLKTLAAEARRVAALYRGGVKHPDALGDLHTAASAAWSELATVATTTEGPDGYRKTSVRLIDAATQAEQLPADRDAADRAYAIVALCIRAERDGLTDEDAAQLDVLAEQLAPANTEAKPTPPGDADDAEELPKALTKNDRLVLKAMATQDVRILMHVKDILDAMDKRQRISEKPAGESLQRLIDADYAERPEGEKAGARLNIQGRKLAGKITD